jgi:hypothetical protein
MAASPEGIEPSPAQWALARMLDAAFDEKDTATRCVELALKNAGRHTIPESIDEVIKFGREHLCPTMAEELGPRLVQALFDDLVADLASLRRSDMRVAAPRRMKSSVPRLTIPPITELPRALPTMQSPPPSEESALRKVVAIVEQDRWARASVARVLVQSGFDVLPLDSEAELVNAAVDVVVFIGIASTVAGARAVAIPKNATSHQITDAVRGAL